MSGFDAFGRIMIFVGIFIIIVGLLFVFWNRIPFLGHLPGDISVQKGNFRFFFPIVTSLLISLVLTIVLNLILWLVRR